MDTYACCRKFFRTQKIILSKSVNFCCSGPHCLVFGILRRAGARNCKALPYAQTHASGSLPSPQQCRLPTVYNKGPRSSCNVAPPTMVKLLIFHLFVWVPAICSAYAKNESALTHFIGRLVQASLRFPYGGLSPVISTPGGEQVEDVLRALETSGQWQRS